MRSRLTQTHEIWRHQTQSGWAHMVKSLYDKDGTKSIEGVPRGDAKFVSKGFKTRAEAQAEADRLNVVQEVLET